MASYATGPTAAATATAPPTMTEQAPHWYEQQKSQDPNARSVTPAMNNTRGVVRNGAAPPGGVASQYSSGATAGAANASGTPSRATTPQQRYYGAYNTPTMEHHQEQDAPQPPPSTGLIRLTLRKPMGIVFEPMYDPNNPTIQRGVRICDLPRTGAAALSRKLEIGDELLSINDKTMSRLTFDEIMDFIIEADPDQVNLLFRRPRKGLPQQTRPPKNMATPQNAVKWPDDDQRKSKKNKKKSPKEKEDKRDKKSSRRSKKDEDSTVVSQEESLEPLPRRKYRSSREIYENETFLDMLIDTICGKPEGGYCGGGQRGDDYYSDEEDTFASMDDSTYVTYESEPPKAKLRSKGRRRADDSTAADETEDDTYASHDEGNDRKGRKGRDKSRDKKKSDRTSKSPTKESKREEKHVSPKRAGRYEEDEETYEETVEETVEPAPALAAAATPPPLGLEPQPDQVAQDVTAIAPAVEAETEDEANPAPIAEVEYDMDHGADVSVMESLGGPSLLIEKQRQAAKAAATAEGPVPTEIVNNFGRGFPADFGLSREQTIQKEPMKFYTFVVKALLEEHEPEKVRLLDKLLAKYKGREDHLVQKLAVRYTKADENPTPTIPEESEGNGFNFSEAVNQTKESAGTADVVKTAKERMISESPDFDPVKWPSTNDTNVEKEAAEEGEEVSMGSESVSGSEYSGDSIDGTSPAVIAQVSELLNYVYGKTSVPGQIDRVSTIMRAYEGREAVLLELLETKALIKANGEKENAADLPSFLRNSPALQHAVGDGQEGPSVDENKPISPLSGPSNHGGVGGLVINDDVSSMSGVSSPADDANGTNAENPSPANPPTSEPKSPEEVGVEVSARPMLSPASKMVAPSGLESPKTPVDRDGKKKKKGIFGGLFGGKQKKNGRKPVKSPGRRQKLDATADRSI